MATEFFLFFIAVVIQGAAGIIGQLIILRELPQIFYGNELSFGIILTAWLFWAALGSGLLGRISYRIKDQGKAYCLLTALATVIIAAIIITIRNARLLLHLIPGEIVTFPLITTISFLIVAPYALLQGLLFTIAARIARGQKDIIANTNIVYLWEAFGALCGCLYYYFWGLSHFDSFQNIFIINSMRLCAVGCLCTFGLHHIRKKTLIALFLLLAINLTLFPLKTINTFFYKQSFHPLHVKDVGESVYGNIVVTQQSQETISFFENGLNLFTTDDIFTIEESTQFALLAHEAPRSVLLLGGGINGSLPFILAHPSVEHITYVELDPLLVEKGETNLSPTAQEYINHPRVTIHYGDARYFVKNTAQTFDVVISLLPAPYTLQINRFYTTDFFQEVTRILKRNGILSFSIASSENFINNEQALLLKSLANSLEAAFRSITILPGNTNIFIATNAGTQPHLSSQYFVDTMRERGVTLDYINEYFLPTRLAQEKIDYLARRIHETPETRINQDFNPISYYYDMILWSEISYPPLQKFITFLLTIHPCYFYIIVFLFFILFFIIGGKRLRMKHSLLLTVGSVGLTEISLEIIIILLFQIFLGYIYSFIGIIIGGYMGGLTLGALLGSKSSAAGVHELSLFKKVIKCELLMILMPLLVLILALLTQSLGFGENMIKAVFFLTMVSTGIIGGMQFPFVNTLYLTRNPNRSQYLGLVYAFDLLGSSVGAFLISAIVIPLFGIPHTLLYLAFINALCLCALLIAKHTTSIHED